MPFTLPTGSGILLCPTGQGFSTISDEEFEALEALEDDNSVAIEEIDFSVYQEWLSNAKEIDATVEQSYTPTTDYFEDSTRSATYKQGILDVSAGSLLEFNDSPHPFPMMDYAANKLSFRTELNQGTAPYVDENGNLKGFGFGYYLFSGDSTFQFPSLPQLFIRNDKFYWVNPTIEKTVFTLTTTEYKEFFTDSFDVADPDGGGGVITVKEEFIFKLRITERFY